MFTDRSDGDLSIRQPQGCLDARREAVAPLPWTWLDQVHSNVVVVVDRPGGAAGSVADAAVTAVPGVTLAVHTADCAGVLLWSTTGVSSVGAAHAGWRGLTDGVLQATVAAMRDLGAGELSWRLGPCISPSAYEFSEDDLAQVASRTDPAVMSRTAEGRPALDLRAGVRAVLERAGAHESIDPDQPVDCTATSGRHYSFRARQDRGRQAAVIWMDLPLPSDAS